MSPFEISAYLSEAAFSERPMPGMLQNQARVKDSFKKQNRPMGFNVTKCRTQASEFSHFVICN